MLSCMWWIVIGSGSPGTYRPGGFWSRIAPWIRSRSSARRNARTRYSRSWSTAAPSGGGWQDLVGCEFAHGANLADEAGPVRTRQTVAWPKFAKPCCPASACARSFTAQDGTIVGVVQHHDGQSDVVVYDSDDPDRCSSMLRLDQAPTPEHAGDLVARRQRVHRAHGRGAGPDRGADLRVDRDSRGRHRWPVVSIRDGELRTRTGASVVAVLRDEAVRSRHPTPSSSSPPATPPCASGTTDGSRQACARCSPPEHAARRAGGRLERGRARLHRDRRGHPPAGGPVAVRQPDRHQRGARSTCSPASRWATAGWYRSMSPKTSSSSPPRSAWCCSCCWRSGSNTTRTSLRHGLQDGGVARAWSTMVANAVPGFAASGSVARIRLARFACCSPVSTWVSSSGIVSKVLFDLDRLGNRETPVVLNVLGHRRPGDGDLLCRSWPRSSSGARRRPPRSPWSVRRRAAVLVILVLALRYGGKLTALARTAAPTSRCCSPCSASPCWSPAWPRASRCRERSARSWSVWHCRARWGSGRWSSSRPSRTCSRRRSSCSSRSRSIRPTSSPPSSRRFGLAVVTALHQARERVVRGRSCRHRPAWPCPCRHCVGRARRVLDRDRRARQLARRRSRPRGVGRGLRAHLGGRGPPCRLATPTRSRSRARFVGARPTPAGSEPLPGAPTGAQSSWASRVSTAICSWAG